MKKVLGTSKKYKPIVYIFLDTFYNIVYDLSMLFTQGTRDSAWNAYITNGPLTLGTFVLVLYIQCMFC